MKKEICAHGYWERASKWEGRRWVSSHKYWCEQSPLPKPNKKVKT